MNPSTARLHRTLIRLLKGCLTAWEKWLGEVAPESREPDTLP